MVKNQCHSKNDTQTATSKMTVRRFGLKLNGFCPGSGFGIKAGQGGGVHTYIQNGIDIFSV